MDRYLTLVGKDLRGYFDQLTGYILLVLFAGLLGYFFSRVAFLTGEASLRPLFGVLPWFLAVLVPAATMRLLAEEERDGTLELLLTHPVREIDIVLSKFLAGWLFIAVALAATVPIPLLLSTAGDVDGGALIAQYIGALLLAAALVALGVFASSMTRNQIVAFLTALGMAFLLMASGLELVFATLPAGVGTLVRDLSLLARFGSVERGVLDLGDVSYFLGVVAAFLSLAYLMVRRRSLSRASRAYRLLLGGVLGLVVLSAAVGWAGGAVPVARLDLTEERLYTLSSATARLVRGLDDILTVQLFSSRELPTRESLTRRDLIDFLEGYERAGGGRVRVLRLFPDEDGSAAAEAQRVGIPQVQFSVLGENQLSVRRGYLGLALRYADRVETVPFVDDTASLEYRLASLTQRLTRRERKVIGFLTGHDELSRNQELQLFNAALSEQFDVVDVAPAEDGALDLSRVDVLIVAGPSRPVPERTRSDLSDYLDRGGKGLVLVEPVNVDVSTLVAAPADDSFADFVARYGVQVNRDLVYDLRANEVVTFGSTQGSFMVQYPLWPRALVQDRTVLGSVETVLMPWASSLDLPEGAAETLKITPLLATTPYSGRMRDSFNLRPQSEETPWPVEGPSLIGVAVSGPEGTAREAAGWRMVVMGDADWLSDAAVRRSAENIVAGLNLVDWLAQEDALVQIRAKGIGSRLLLPRSAAHETAIRFGSMLGVPLAVLLLGLVRYAARRRQLGRVYDRAG